MWISFKVVDKARAKAYNLRQIENIKNPITEEQARLKISFAAKRRG